MSARLTKADKALLQPYADLVARIYEQIEGADSEELTALLSATARADQGNCWWATYKAARIVSEIVSGELHRRSLQGGE